MSYTNAAFTSRSWVKFTAIYRTNNLNEDTGTGFDVDSDHAVIIRTRKVAVIVSIRNERTGLWRQVSIPKNTIYTLNVSEANLINVSTTSSGKTGIVKIKTTNRSFDPLNIQFENFIDEKESSAKRFEWEPKIQVVAS